VTIRYDYDWLKSLAEHYGDKGETFRFPVEGLAGHMGGEAAVRGMIDRMKRERLIREVGDEEFVLV